MTFGGGVDLGADFAPIEGLVKDAMRSPHPVSGSDPQHYPYARQVRLSWYQDGSGKWAYDGLDDHQWEVFCQQCGDTDGPAENQEPPVRQLRGPYRGKHRADHAASKHFKAYQVH
jgi:hypothetical protein